MCGVVGIIGPHLSQIAEEETNSCWPSYDVYSGLLTLQHRGQDAAGILSFDENRNRFFGHKDLGLVANVFDQKALDGLHGSMAIGHTRYATSGSDRVQDIQPLVTGFPFGVGMVHNGNIVNYSQLAQSLQQKWNFQLLTSNDLELFLDTWCQKMSQSGSTGQLESSELFEKALEPAKEYFKHFHGGYAVIGMMANEGMFGIRDPKGIRPLVIGVKELPKGHKSYCLASESVTLNFLGYKTLRDVKPGEMVFINHQGELYERQLISLPEKELAPCMFEWIYFSGAESTLENRSVYNVRLRLGKQLAAKAKDLINSGDIAPDVICPVPDTSRTSSISLAEELNIPYREGLIKNRYVQRSFILKSQKQREQAVQLKLSPVLSEIEGKNLFLVDDSIVRGTTSKQIISLLKKNGAKKITMAITCPPLRHPCYYGIDFPDPKELIASERTEEEIAQWIGADKVIYLEEKDLYEAIRKEGLCTACVTNKYPTDVSEGDNFTKWRQQQR